MTAIATWPVRAETRLDPGKAAWIAALVLGFVVFRRLALAILGCMIRKIRGSEDPAGARPRTRCTAAAGGAMPSTGNSAFDACRAASQKRLGAVQATFRDFLEPPRKARDQTEFDAFMDKRARRRRDDARAGPAGT